jgi:hypothetical protein
MDFAQRRARQRMRAAPLAFRCRGSALRESALSWHLKISCEINMIIRSGKFPEGVTDNPRAQAMRGMTRRDGHPRQQALRRLTGRWLEEVSRDPATVHRMPLRAVLIEENIRATQALDLYADYDDFGERQRGHEMIRAVGIAAAPRVGAMNHPSKKHNNEKISFVVSHI